MTVRQRGLFVTGTDTGIGKTFVSLLLMQSFRCRGFRVAGMKPVATGCDHVEGRLCNDDARLLRGAASCELPYDWVNPYAFAPAVAPNIAAEWADRRIDMSLIEERYHLLRRNIDGVIVEGIGGWEVPLNERERVSDLARMLRLPVVLVVGLRLGCLNHAILTERAIRASGVDYRGWIANGLCGNFPALEANVRTLQDCLTGAFLGQIPFRPANGIAMNGGAFRHDPWL